MPGGFPAIYARPDVYWDDWCRYDGQPVPGGAIGNAADQQWLDSTEPRVAVDAVGNIDWEVKAGNWTILNNQFGRRFPLAASGGVVSHIIHAGFFNSGQYRHNYPNRDYQRASILRCEPYSEALILCTHPIPANFWPEVRLVSHVTWDDAAADTRYTSNPQAVIGTRTVNRVQTGVKPGNIPLYRTTTTVNVPVGGSWRTVVGWKPSGSFYVETRIPPFEHVAVTEEKLVPYPNSGIGASSYSLVTTNRFRWENYAKIRMGRPDGETLEVPFFVSPANEILVSGTSTNGVFNILLPYRNNSGGWFADQLQGMYLQIMSEPEAERIQAFYQYAYTEASASWVTAGPFFSARSTQGWFDEPTRCGFGTGSVAGDDSALTNFGSFRQRKCGEINTLPWASTAKRKYISAPSLLFSGSSYFSPINFAGLAENQTQKQAALDHFDDRFAYAYDVTLDDLSYMIIRNELEPTPDPNQYFTSHNTPERVYNERPGYGKLHPFIADWIGQTVTCSAGTPAITYVPVPSAFWGDFRRWTFTHVYPVGSRPLNTTEIHNWLFDGVSGAASPYGQEVHGDASLRAELERIWDSCVEYAQVFFQVTLALGATTSVPPYTSVMRADVVMGTILPYSYANGLNQQTNIIHLSPAVVPYPLFPYFGSFFQQIHIQPLGGFGMPRDNLIWTTIPAPATGLDLVDGLVLPGQQSFLLGDDEPATGDSTSQVTITAKW